MSIHFLRRNSFSPYIFAGIGLGMTKVDVDFSNLSDNQQLQNEIAIDLRNQKDTHLSLPFGIGVKADISEKMLLTLELGMRPVFNDYLDGVSAVGNAERDDWYSIGAITVAYRFGSKDQDKDGIADLEDDCPFIPGMIEAKGCRDSDHDGIADNVDRCPHEKGLAECDGCSVPDRDRVLDADDHCPDKPGTGNGCPDTDSDGLADDVAPCPDKAGTNGGCPDTDGDGLADNMDDCPEQAGPVERKGCPLLSEKDKSVLLSAADNISFHQGSYKLVATSYPMLNSIADIMKHYPTYHLKIEGYTDNRGNDQSNLQLSEMRAKACLEYLYEKQGIAKERMSYKGYGKANPRASNDTMSGRRRNRRVEFKIYE